jgi:hypothetical protein
MMQQAVSYMYEPHTACRAGKTFVPAAEIYAVRVQQSAAGLGGYEKVPMKSYSAADGRCGGSCVKVAVL